MARTSLRLQQKHEFQRWIAQEEALASEILTAYDKVWSSNIICQHFTNPRAREQRKLNELFRAHWELRVKIFNRFTETGVSVPGYRIPLANHTLYPGYRTEDFHYKNPDKKKPASKPI